MKLTQKYNYPEKAIAKGTKQVPSKRSLKSRNNGKKFPEGVAFPSSNDTIYPREYNSVVYDVLKLKVIFDREKTGAEDTAELDLKEKDVIAGRYRV